MIYSLLPVLVLSYLIRGSFSYDYVFIGGGTAGLTVASRLAEDDNVKVLVLEAGSYEEDLPEVFIPGLFGAGRAFTDLNWNYITTAQVNLKNRTTSIAGGKALGGSSVINGMIFSRAEKEQYNAWGILNNEESWKWNSLLPYFKKSEIFTPPNSFQTANGARYLPDVHGFHPVAGKGVKSGFGNFFFPQSELWEKTAVALGFRQSPDLTNGEPEAVGVSPNSIDAVNNTRCSAVCAFYNPVKDKQNFKVIMNATVLRIIWSKSSIANASSALVASGVEYLIQNSTEPQIVNLSGGGEVIVSAGTIGSPKVLELSGVGNSTILKAAGVQPVLEHPTVGENLADHLHSWVNSFTNATVTGDPLFRDPVLAQEQLDLWYKNRTGILSGGSGRTLAIVPPSQIFSSSELQTLLAETKSTLPQFAKEFSNGNADLAKGIEAQHRIGIELYASDTAGPLEMNLVPGYVGPTPPEQRPPNSNFTSITVVVYAPLSRGRTHITSSNISVPPAVNPGYWSHPLDVAAHVSGINLARKMLRTGPLGGIYQGEFEPGLNVTTDEDIKEWLAGSAANGDNHPTGTMAMLPQELGGVVDTRLRVYGIKNVRVIGESLFPFFLWSIAFFSSFR
ncbi:alcohol oxidase [Marasmius fiardii PR-910]|nr:alcohol oxidase [Marasmius fiardii PR-910]